MLLRWIFLADKPNNTIMSYSPPKTPATFNPQLSTYNSPKNAQLKLLHRMVCRTGGDGHKGEGRVLGTGGGHAGAIGYKYILAGM